MSLRHFFALSLVCVMLLSFSICVHACYRIGGFSEEGKGTPEDLLFFYKHLDMKGRLWKVPECLLVYRYHPHATTFSIDEYVHICIALYFSFVTEELDKDKRTVLL